MYLSYFFMSRDKWQFNTYDFKYLKNNDRIQLD